jgi:hypothetical protein
MNPPFLTRYKVQVEQKFQVKKSVKSGIAIDYSSSQGRAPLNYQQSRFIVSPDFFAYKSFVKIPS